MKALVWPIATYGQWKLDNQKEWRNKSSCLWYETAQKDSAGIVDSKEKNEWVLNKAAVKRELLDTAKARKLAYYEKTRELFGEREIMQGTINARAGCTQARKTKHGLDGQHQYVDRTHRGKSIRMTEDRHTWRNYVHDVANPQIEDGWRTKQNIIIIIL